MAPVSSPSASRPSARAAEPLAPRRLRRLPWFPIGLSALVLLAWPFAIPPIKDAATGDVVGEAQLMFPAGYLALSPLYDVLDTITLLGVRQHVALLVTLLAGFLVWRAWPRRARAAVPLGRRLLREALYLALWLGALVGLYALMALVPRPMARLVVTDPDVLALDVHAHTQSSHDGRDGWTPEHVRRWAAGAGFDASYISDHRTFEGFREGAPNNPAFAGQGTTLLPSIEVIRDGERVNILSAGTTYGGLTDVPLINLDVEALRLASLVPGKEPVLVQTIPADLDRVVAHAGAGTPGVRAIEVIDGGPRGIGQARRDRARIVRMADSLNLALVAGSDNHGYGRTAPGWTLLRIAGWRNARPAQMAEAIESVLRSGGRGSTRVVERVVADPGYSVLQLVLTLPIVTWRMLTTLAPEQRLMWLVWIWALALAAVAVRRGRARRAAA